MPRTSVSTPAAEALAQDLLLLLTDRSRGAGFAEAEIDVAADVIVEHLHSRGLVSGMSRAAMVRGLAAFLGQRSTGHGFDYVDLDIAAVLALDWLDGRGVLTLSALPPTVMVLTDHWPDATPVTSVHVSLVDAQIAARTVVASRGRALGVGASWDEGVDAKKRHTWRWSPEQDGHPVGQFVITESALS